MDVIQFIKEIGIPGGLAFALIWFVVIPLKDTHINFVNELKVSIKELTKAQENLTKTIDLLAERLQEIEERTARLKHIESN